MTKKQFEEYMASFHRQPGEYTDEERYLIGLAHRDLDKKDKDWNKLAIYLGTEQTGETYRKWVSKRCNKEGDINQVFNDIFVEKQKLRNEANSFRRTLRDESRIDEMKEIIAKKIGELGKMPYIKVVPLKDKEKKEAVLLLSDLHIGVNVNEFYNTYNVNIARKRIAELTAQTIELCKDNNVGILNVCNLGDMIQGIIHISARLEQEIDVIEQIMTASEILSNMLNELKKSGAKVIYRSVIDNHSRATANLKEHIEKENFNRLIDWYIEERLKNNDIEFRHDNLDLEIGKIELQNGKKLVFTHGHHDNFKTALQSYLGATKEYIDYICFGHYHNSKMETYQNAKVIVNGSIVGTEQYAYSKRLFSEPEQTLLLFGKKSLSINYINLKGVK